MATTDQTPQLRPQAGHGFAFSAIALVLLLIALVA
jgi:hypothetical protein